MGRDEDGRRIDWIVRRAGLTKAERRQLHDLITKQGLTSPEIEGLALALRRSRRRRKGPHEEVEGPQGHA